MKDGTQELETGKLSAVGDRLPGEWVADPITQDDRPRLMGLQVWIIYFSDSG